MLHFLKRLFAAKVRQAGPARRVRPALEALENREVPNAAGIPTDQFSWGAFHWGVRDGQVRLEQAVGVVLPGEARGFNPQPDPPGVVVPGLGDGSIPVEQMALKQRLGDAASPTAHQADAAHVQTTGGDLRAAAVAWQYKR